MAWNDSGTTYGAISRLNHWIGALLLLLLLAIGLLFEDLPRGPELSALKALHIAFGTIAIPFLVFRVFWRLRAGTPQPLPQPRALMLLSKAVHIGLLLCIVVLVVTGPLSIWAIGRPFGIAGVLQIPSPLPLFKAWHEPLEHLHGWAADGVIALVILHLLGVVKHQFIDRDALLARMTGRGA
jgi:cytochrome b561